MENFNTYICSTNSIFFKQLKHSYRFGIVFLVAFLLSGYNLHAAGKLSPIDLSVEKSGVEANLEAYMQKQDMQCSVCNMIDFNGESKGLITTIKTEQGLVKVTGKKRNPDGTYASGNYAAIFDTQAPTGDDTDLYTTNWGNALIINQDRTAVPNDNQWGGELILDFSAIGPVTLESLKALDIDNYENMSWVYLYDGNGRELHKVQLKSLGNNSRQMVNLGNMSGVMSMRVVLDGRNEMGKFAGSGAIDDIKFCVAGTPPSAPKLEAVHPTCTVGTGSIMVTSEMEDGMMFSVNGGAYAAHPTNGWTGLKPGTYTVMARSASGCLSAATTIMLHEQPAMPEPPRLVAVQPNCLLSSGAITIISPVADMMFSVNGGAYEAYPAKGWYGLASGTYTITARNEAGCVSDASTVVINSERSAATACHWVAFDYDWYNTGMISEINTPSGTVSVMGKKRNQDGTFASGNHAALFDTQDPTGDDTDLYTTNWGQALIINQDMSGAPNDNQYGGELILNFSDIGPVTMQSVNVLDIDVYSTMSWIYLYDRDGKELHRVQLKNLGNNSRQWVDFGDIKGVMSMRVVLEGRDAMGNITGSGAIDDIRFCVESKTACEENMETVEEKSIEASTVEATAYPTPFTDRTTIQFRVQNNESYAVNLYDTKGLLIKQLEAGTAVAGELNTIEVDGRNLAEGMYLAKIATDSGTKTVKLILRR